MRRRTFLTTLTATVGGVTAVSSESFAADAALDCGVWYDAEITDTIDGDTFDVYVFDNGTEYNVRTIGHDSPEKSGNTRYEKTEEWEFIEDAAHLENWGNEASQFAADELPIGTACQVKLDCASEEIDQYGRLLAKVRYDRSGDGSMDTVWNELTVEQGYARVYAASMSNADEYVDLQRSARANGRGVWAAADGSAPEWRNEDVAETFHPHTSSIRTTSGALPDARAPVWAESTAVQENTTTSTVAYDAVPLVGVDEPSNLAYFGGVPINERWEDDAAALEQFVFVANLVDYLHDSSDPSGPYLVDGGHHTFGQDNAVSAEDVAYFQRFLEGVGIELHSINTYGDTTGYSLSEGRALVASSSPDAWTSAEVSEVQSFLDGGGVVLLMGSGSETSGERANLDALAADLGSDLRLNEDDVRDDTNNVGTRKLLKTANRNTADFSVWSAYGTSGGGSDAVVEFGAVEQYPAATLNDEYVELTNTGSADQDMTGWTLQNGDGDSYTFPDGFTLTAGGTVRVHTGSGTDASTDGDVYWGASTFRWDNDADTAALYDDGGSLVRETAWSLPDVVVPALDEDNEWVDFENRSGAGVDMAGWAVEDEAGNRYDFPTDFSLAAGDTVRLHSGSGTDSSTDLYWGAGYVWNNDGDTCLLYDDAGELVQQYTYPAPYSVSIPQVSLGGDTLNDEYVDVRNDGSGLLELSGFTLQDAAGYTYTFPESFTLDAGATVRVHTGDGTDTATDLYWGRGSPVWNDDGDTAYVYDDNDRLAASNSASGGTDSAPSVSWANPADGSTVSGSVPVQISGSDSEDADDSLTVEYAVDGGSLRTATYDSTSGYYEDSWDSTAVADGDHTLEARATDAAGNTSTSSITVTADNSTDSSTAPAIDQFAVTNDSNGGWARFEVSWDVSDADGDLSSVDLTMDQNGTVDSASTSVSGSSAAGSDRLQDKKGSGSYDITLTVTDAAGNAATRTKTFTA